MTAITHKRSTHIDAPVETVFGYVEDPHHFFAAMAPMSGDRGPTWTFTFEPNPTGTTLTLAYEYSLRVPLVVKAVDALVWNGDRDIDTMLAFFKRETEA